MRSRKKLVMLSVVLMIFTVAGIFAGCGSKDSRNEKPVEVQGGDSAIKEEEEMQVTATPVPTPTPEPTPEAFPTAKELWDEYKGIGENAKAEMRVAYKQKTEYGEAKISGDMVVFFQDNIQYRKETSLISMNNQNSVIVNERYYVDDEENGRRTEYQYDREAGKWVKFEYAYDVSEDAEETVLLEGMENGKVTGDEEFYYLTGEIDSKEIYGEDFSLNLDPIEVKSITYTAKFDKETKKYVSMEIVVGLNKEENALGMIFEEDILCVMEACTVSISIPKEVLAAELIEKDAENE